MPEGAAHANHKPAWDHLRLWAEQLNDAEAERIRADNRVASKSVHPDTYLALVENLAAMEKVCLDETIGWFREAAPEIAAFVDETPGLGEKTVARFLGATGHPYHAQPYTWVGKGKADRKLVALEPYDRSLRQWWSYCGIGDPARKRREGMTADDAMALGNQRAKTRIHVVAERSLRWNPGFKAIYDAGREAYATRDGWPKGRQHAAAMRLVKKHIAEAFWQIAKDAA